MRLPSVPFQQTCPKGQVKYRSRHSFELPGRSRTSPIHLKKQSFLKNIHENQAVDSNDMRPLKIEVQGNIERELKSLILLITNTVCTPQGVRSESNPP